MREQLGSTLAHPVPLSQQTNLLQIILPQLETPTLKILLQSAGVARSRNDADPSLQCKF